MSPPRGQSLQFITAASGNQARTWGGTSCNSTVGGNVGEGLGRAIPGVAFLRTRVFRNAHPEDDPPGACHPSAPVATRSQQRLTPREESRKRAFLPVWTLRRRGTPGRVFCVQTDGQTRTLRVYTLPSHTVLPPPEQRGVHFVPTHQPVLPYPVRACRHKPCLQHLARD